MPKKIKTGEENGTNHVLDSVPTASIDSNTDKRGITEGNIVDVEKDTPIKEAELKEIKKNTTITREREVSIQRNCKVLFKKDGLLYIRFNANHDICYPYGKDKLPEIVSVAYSGTFGKNNFNIIDIEID